MKSFTVAPSSLYESWVIRVVPKIARTSGSSPALRFYQELHLDSEIMPVCGESGAAYLGIYTSDSVCRW